MLVRAPRLDAAHSRPWRDLVRESHPSPQFRLYAENGELDLDLLSMTSEQLVYKQIPSTVPGKYVYLTDHHDIRTIQHLLFSDQSHLGYIDEELNADSLAQLLLGNSVSYDRFAGHQKLGIDFLLTRGVLVNDDSQIKLASAAQFLALRELWDNDAGNYWRHSPGWRAVIDAMVADGWLERRSTLLTTSDGTTSTTSLIRQAPPEAPIFGTDLSPFSGSTGPRRV